MMAASNTNNLETDQIKISTVFPVNGIEKHSASRININSSANSKFASSDAVDGPLSLAITRSKGGDDEHGSYNPFLHRQIVHPTSDLQTLVNLLKGCLGSGFLAMPFAFLNAGVWFGLMATFIVGGVCTYCVHILVKCAHILCRRREIPMMSFADVAEQAFLDGPPSLNRWAGFMRCTVNVLLVIDLLGSGCIQLVCAASNVKQLADFYLGELLTVHAYIAIATLLLTFICLIRNLRTFKPYSMTARMLMLLVIILAYSYVFVDLPTLAERSAVAEIMRWPMFFGTVLFALECVAVVISLENKMKQPTHLIGCPSVLNVGMSLVVCVYALVGLFGYWKCGSDTMGSLTLNLPVDQYLGQAVKLLVAVAILSTFTLQFYVPVNIIWQGLQHKISPERHDISEYGLRVVLVIACGTFAMLLPNLGAFIALIGASCLSILGLIVPSLIELAVYNVSPGFGRFKWRLWKNSAIICFGVVGFFTGIYASILEFHDKLSFTQK